MRHCWRRRRCGWCCGNDHCGSEGPSSRHATRESQRKPPCPTPVGVPDACHRYQKTGSVDSDIEHGAGRVRAQVSVEPVCCVDNCRAHNVTQDWRVAPHTAVGGEWVEYIVGALHPIDARRKAKARCIGSWRGQHRVAIHGLHASAIRRLLRLTKPTAPSVCNSTRPRDAAVAHCIT